jgi:hypothetical protein
LTSLGRGHPQSAAIGSTQRFLKKIRRGYNATLVVLSDSTAAHPEDWAYLLGQWLGVTYPAINVDVAFWDDTTQAYPAATRISTGSGSQTITIWIAAIPGKPPVYHLVGFEDMCGSKEPDLVIISHGHNETGISYSNVRDRMLALTETLLLRNPQASVILTAQNPNTTDDFQGLRAEQYQQIAQTKGFGFIDVHQAFLDYGTWQADLMLNSVHPNDAGQLLWHATVTPAFTYQPWYQPQPQTHSSLSVPVRNMLTNGDMASFASPPTLDSWTATAVDLVKDLDHFDGPNGYAVRMRATAASGSLIYQPLSAAQVRTLRGTWLTVAARIYVRGSAGSNTAGRAGIQTNVASITTPSILRTDGWHWSVASQLIDPAAIFIYANVFGDAAAPYNDGDTAVALDGASQYATTAMPAFSSGFTVIGRFKRARSGANEALWSGGTGRAIVYFATDDYLYFQELGTSGYLVRSANTITDTDSHYFAVTWTPGTSTPTLEVDGVAGTLGAQTALGVTSATYYIGRRADSSTYYFSGTLDEYSVYTTPISAAARLADWKASGSAGYNTQAIARSPYAYYRMGEPSGSTLHDSSGGSHDGSYVGSPTLGAGGVLMGGDISVDRVILARGILPRDLV